MSNPALNIASFGAVPDGKTDNAPLINRILVAAKAQQQGVYIPPGTFAYGEVLNADGVDFHGAGPDSVLYSLNEAKASIFVRGRNTSVRAMRLTGVPASGRFSKFEYQRVSVLGALAFDVSDLNIDSGAAGGIIVSRGSVGGVIKRNKITNTMADSIHITDRSSEILIQANECFECGDDGVAVVSYAAQGGPVHHITARDNRVSKNKHGRCFSVVGGEDVLYESNFASGNAGAAGIYIAQESSYKTLGCARVTVRRNTVVDCGNAGISHPAVYILSSGEFPTKDVLVERNLISQSTELVGIRVRGMVQNTSLDQNVVIGTPPLYLQTEGIKVTPYTNGPVGVVA